MLEISRSFSSKTLTLTIIEEVSVGVFVSITCHLKYDSAVTARPWGMLVCRHCHLTALEPARQSS